MSVAAIERRCGADDADERQLRIDLVGELRRLVGFDAHVWALTDPVTEVGVAPLADVPEAVFADLPGLIRRRYLTPVNRWGAVAGTADSLHRATGGEPSRSLLFREVLDGLGVIDVASVVFRDRGGLWGWLDLWRIGGEPFSASDVERLASVAPAITEGVRRRLARTFDDPAPVPHRTGPAVLFLAPSLEVRGQTPDTDGLLRALLPPDADRRPIPAGAFNVAAQLLAHEAGVDDRPPSSRMHLGGGAWLTMRAARVEGDGVAGERDIAVTIEPTSPAERRDLYSRSHVLSARETELVEHLASGADTRALAEALFLSEHTVQDHLKSIFAKTGTRNRRTLLTRIVGR